MDTTAHPDFDKIVSQTEANLREQNLKSNDAFVLAMARAVSRGKEKDRSGTFKDSSPAHGARRICGDPPASAYGSPAAMCMGR